MSEAPKKIYLQIQGDYFGYTWYHRPIGNTGIKYIRADLVARLREAFESLVSAITEDVLDSMRNEHYYKIVHLVEMATAAFEAGKVDE